MLNILLIILCLAMAFWAVAFLLEFIRFTLEAIEKLIKRFKK